MPKSEKAILNETLVEVSAVPKTLIWRNNTGQAWQGERVPAAPGDTIRVERGMVVLREARPISFGLPGSGDILGVHMGDPLSIEIKTETGRQSQIQKNFEERWRLAGGKYLLVRSADEALQALLDR